MKKGKKNKKVLLAIVGVVVLISLIALGFFAFGIQESMLPAGISNVVVKDQGERILVYARTGGGSELNLYLSPEQLNKYLEPQGYKANKGLTLSAEYVKGYKRFSFFTTESEQNSIKLIKYAGSFNIISPFSPCDANACSNHGFANAITAYYTGFPPFAKCHCYSYKNHGYVNSFTGHSSGGFKVKFTLDGETKYLEDDRQSITMKNGLAKITWYGNLLGINEVNPPNMDVFHVANSWYLVGKNAYSNVESGFVDFKRCVGLQTTKETLSSCLSRYNSIINSNIYPRDQEYINSISNVKSVSFVPGEMLVELAQPTFIPTFIIELDADLVQIVKLSGKPQIVSCIPDQVFDEAGSKKVSARIKNIGEAQGFFEFSITCDNPEMSGRADSIDVDPGETKTVYFQLAGGNSKQTTNKARCTLTVTDRNSGYKDSCNFNFDVKYKSGISECNDGETKCSSDRKILYTCENGVWQPKACDYRCEYLASGGAYCAEKEPGQIIVPPSQGELKCKWYQTSYTQNYCGFLCKIGLEEPKVTSGCKLAGWAVAIIIGGIILILILLWRVVIKIKSVFWG